MDAKSLAHLSQPCEKKKKHDTNGLGKKTASNRQGC